MAAEFGDGSSKSSVCSHTAPSEQCFGNAAAHSARAASETQNFTIKKYLSKCWGSDSSGTQVHHQLSNHSSSDVLPGSHCTLLGWVCPQISDLLPTADGYGEQGESPLNSPPCQLQEQFSQHKLASGQSQKLLPACQDAPAMAQ